MELGERFGNERYWYSSFWNDTPLERNGGNIV
jgi:hypothetical protein